MRMALIDKNTEQPILFFPRGPEHKTRFELPDGSQVSPATLGWENDEYIIVEITPMDVPEGKRISGVPSYSLVNDELEETYKLEETYTLEDIPPKGPLDYPLKRWQFRAMVDYLGKGPAIEAAISAITDPMTKAVALARYKDSDLYERADPLFDQLAPIVGLTDAEIDAAWMQIAVGGI